MRELSPMMSWSYRFVNHHIVQRRREVRRGGRWSNASWKWWLDIEICGLRWGCFGGWFVLKDELVWVNWWDNWGIETELYRPSICSRVIDVSKSLSQSVIFETGTGTRTLARWSQVEGHSIMTMPRASVMRKRQIWHADLVSWRLKHTEYKP